MLTHFGTRKMKVFTVCSLRAISVVFKMSRQFGFRPLTRQILSSVRSLHLPYHVKEETPADGNCFFHAVLDQLREEGNCPFANHMDLRKQLVAFVRNNAALQRNESFRVGALAYIRANKFQNERNEVAWNRLLQDMCRFGVWAADIFITCMSIFLQRVIKITSSSQSIRFPWLTFKPKDLVVWQKPLTIAMLPQTHFQSIHPTENSNSKCLGCGWQILGSLARHVSHSDSCKDFYNLLTLREPNISARNQTRASSNETFSDSMTRVLRKLSLPFEPSDMVHVGTDSFFDCVLAQLSKEEQEFHGSGRKLREDVLAFLKSNNPIFQSDFFQNLKKNYIDSQLHAGETVKFAWAEILRNFADGMWPDEFFVQCTSLYLSRNIVVTSDKQNKCKPWVVFQGNSLSWQFPICLFFKPGITFQPLQHNGLSDVQCLSCGDMPKSLYLHISRKKTCQIFHDLVKLRTS
jgi:hypothetical protein